MSLMMRWSQPPGVVLAVSLVFAGAAMAATLKTTSEVTQLVRKPALACSVSERATYSNDIGHGLQYGGSVSCQNGVGLKTVTVYMEVQNGTHWFVIGGSRVSTGVRREQPAHIDTMRQTVAGHRYRVIADGEVTWNGYSISGVAVSQTTTAI